MTTTIKPVTPTAMEPMSTPSRGVLNRVPAPVPRIASLKSEEHHEQPLRNRIKTPTSRSTRVQPRRPSFLETSVDV